MLGRVFQNALARGLLELVDRVLGGELPEGNSMKLSFLANFLVLKNSI